MDGSSPAFPHSDILDPNIQEPWPGSEQANLLAAFDYRSRQVQTTRFLHRAELGLALEGSLPSHQSSASPASLQDYTGHAELEMPRPDTDFGTSPAEIVPVQASSWLFSFQDTPFTFEQHPLPVHPSNESLAHRSSDVRVASSSKRQLATHTQEAVAIDKRRPRKRKRVIDPKEYTVEDVAQNVMLTRRPGACTHCRKGKMRCEFLEGENTCKRCKVTGRHCVVEGPKPQSQKEDLITQLRQKDTIIESLLRQLDSLQFLKRVSPEDGQRAPSLPLKSEAFSPETWADHFKIFWQPTTGSMDSTIAQEPVHGNSTSFDGGTVPEFNNIVKSEPASDEAIPLELISRLSLSNSDESESGDRKSGEERFRGWDDKTYFKPEPNSPPHFGIPAKLLEHKKIPDIVAHGLVTPPQVDDLFDIFFTRMNVHILLLDPILHNPSTTFYKSPFLFSVVCAIASRYYDERPDMYPVAMHFAKHAAANTLVTGRKSIDIVLAFMLLAYYMEPCKRWEDHRTWLYIGVAVRVAVDLKLHQMPPKKPATELEERELLNRARVWMTCYTLDRSVSTYYGRPFAFKEDRNIRNATHWYKSSRYNSSLDISLCAYACLLRLTSRFSEEVFSDPDEIASINKNIDYLEVVKRYDAHWGAYLEEWEGNFRRDADLNDPKMIFRRRLFVYVASYARLVMWSTLFQQVFEDKARGGDRPILDKCFEIATSIIDMMVNTLARNRYMRYSSDGHYIYATYASGFLVKLLKPRFESLLRRKQRYQIFETVENLVQVYSSVEMSTDDTHTPRQHARFLSTLLSPYRKGSPNSPKLIWLSPSDMWPLPDIRQSPESSSGQSASASGSSGVASTSELSPAPHHGELQMPIPQSSESPMEHQATVNFDDELLGTFEALNDPGFWESMVMPDVQWMEQDINPPDHPPGGFYPYEYTQ